MIRSASWTSAVVCSMFVSAVVAGQVPPPTTVDAADPVPGEMPHLSSHASPHPASAASSDSFLSSAKVLPPGSLLPYTGLEYTLGPLTVRPAEMRMESLFLIFFLFYSLSTLLIRRQNTRTASTWFRSNEKVLRQEFAGVGFGTDDQLWKVDGGDEYVSYFSGRRAVEYGWAKLNLEGYDLLTKAYYALRRVLDPNYDPRTNKIILDFKLSPLVGTPGAKMCFALLRRDQLKRLQDSRWDLRTFTKLSESLPIAPELIVMTESGDVTSALLLDSVNTGLKDVLKSGTEELDCFESLIVSDMPVKEPDSTNPKLPTDEFHLILTLRLPPKSRSSSTESLISLACNIADVIHRKEKLLPEVAISKANKRRSDTLATLLKNSSSSFSRTTTKPSETTASLKRKSEQEALERKLSSMTPGERMKFKQKEDEKESKKRVVKVSRKGGK
ncbi:hypothetical protein JCM16303_004872 [Sporobolomyces ruberrimus]